MSLQIITLYCLCDEFVRAWGLCDDVQSRLSNAEIMTIALVATTFFQGNYQLSLTFLTQHGYLKTMSKSRFNRRLHALPEALWQALLALLAQIRKQGNTTGEYLTDSCPIPVCQNIRIARCRLYAGEDKEDFRGYIASKRQYFFGLRIHLLVTAEGFPIEVVLLPGSVSDIVGLRSLPLDLPEGAVLYADAAYNDYGFEDDLATDDQITLVAARRKNSKRPHPGALTYICQVVRKRIETTFSQIAQRFPKKIHAVTRRGLELKVFLTVLAFAILG
jgi:Transposase DDE domain